MIEVLSGAVPCKKCRHTGEYVEDATFQQLAALGIDDPVSQIFKAKTDRGSNMIKGYEKLSHDPCADHLIDSSCKVYLEHPAVSPFLRQGRAIVGSFNMSTIGKADLAKCQVTVGSTVKNLIQDVVTRWASTHSMTNSLRENMDALLMYELKYAAVASETFLNNKLTAEGWIVVCQTAAVLGGLAAASNVSAPMFRRGKTTPPSTWYCRMCMAASLRWQPTVARSSCGMEHHCMLLICTLLFEMLGLLYMAR